MKQFHRSMLAIGMALAVALLAGTSSVGAQAGGTVTASAVAVPARSSEMGFLLSGPVKEVDVKAGDLVKAGQTLIALDTPELGYGVVAAEAAVKSAQADAELQKFARKVWNGSKFVYLSGPPELRQIADDKVVQAQAALEIARARLAQAMLVAPYDGTVVKVSVVRGELIQPTQAAITIGTLDHLQIETTDLSERDIARVVVGQSAVVSVEALDKDFNGKVIRISPMADTVGGDVVFKVTIELDEQPAGLLWGMSAEVQINTGQ